MRSLRGRAWRRASARGGSTASLWAAARSGIFTATASLFGFPRPVWTELMEQGRVVRHPIDHPGWAARSIETDDDIWAVIELIRLNYDRVTARNGPPTTV